MFTENFRIKQKKIPLISNLADNTILDLRHKWSLQFSIVCTKGHTTLITLRLIYNKIYIIYLHLLYISHQDICTQCIHYIYIIIYSLFQAKYIYSCTVSIILLLWHFLNIFFYLAVTYITAPQKFQDIPST